MHIGPVTFARPDGPGSREIPVFDFYNLSSVDASAFLNETSRVSFLPAEWRSRNIGECGGATIRDLLLQARYGDSAHATDCLAIMCERDGSEARSMTSDACFGLALAALTTADSEMERDLTAAALMWALRVERHGDASLPLGLGAPPPASAVDSANRVLRSVYIASRALNRPTRPPISLPPSSWVDAVTRLQTATSTRADSLGALGLRLSSKQVATPMTKPPNFRAEPGAVVGGGPTIGIFVLRGPERTVLMSGRRTAGKDWGHGPALGWSLRSVWREAPELRRKCRLHVLIDFLPVPRVTTGLERESATPPSTVEEEHVVWSEALGPAAAWFEGVDTVHASALPLLPRQGNYLRKIYHMWLLAKRKGYTHIMSMDDDIIMAPQAIIALLKSPPGRDLDIGVEFDGASDASTTQESRCAITTPTISTGIPTVEMFALDFMSPSQQAALDSCLCTTIDGVRQDIAEHNRLATQVTDIGNGQQIRNRSRVFLSKQGYGSVGGWFVELVESGPDFCAVSSGTGADGQVRRRWLGDRWYGHVKKRLPEILGKEVSLLWAGTIDGLAGGLHPVRANSECQRLVGNTSMSLMESHLGRSYEESGAGNTAVEVQVHDLPYLANSAWLATTATFGSILRQKDAVFGWPHPFDEAAMNLLRLETRTPLCVVRGTLVFHPEYGGAGSELERQLHSKARGVLRRRAMEEPGEGTNQHGTCRRRGVGCVF